MCTVTYIPQAKGQFILTSNRDESPARSPQQVSQAALQGLSLVFPKDTGAGGTWIAAAADNRVTCLLNGAFDKHRHEPPYRRSRGLMVLDFFEFPSLIAFEEAYDFRGIEPFTLVTVDNGELFELRWDGDRAHLKALDAESPCIWSSATLYPGEVGKMREAWFREWLDGRSDFSLEAIRALHLNGGAGDLRNGFVMNRDEVVRTVSITHVIKSSNHIEMHYQDLLRNLRSREQMAITAVTA
ncbi:MAG: hypothetical protein RI973_694 [Bacteroidota bacterium]|jgi:hypothetical protein